MSSYTFTVAIVSDCGGQAMSRMMVRVNALMPGARCIAFESACLIEASGNIVDALDAFSPHTTGAILCNSAPRKDARETNGSAIVAGSVGLITLISTAGALGLVRKLVPNLMVRKLNVNAFLSQCVKTDRHTFNFRGLEVIPHILKHMHYYNDKGSFLFQDFFEPFDQFPAVDSCVWHVDTIGGHPTNLKLTILRDECKGFEKGHTARVLFPKSGASHEIPCFERLTDIPTGSLGLYEGSSGLGNRRFLEIAVMGGSAAKELGVRAGDPISITIS